MDKFKIIGTVLVALSCGWACAAVSEPVVVWANPEESLQWKTVMENPMRLDLTWPDGAVTATLTVSSGMSAVETPITDTSLGVLPVEVSWPADEPSERVLDLTLAYKDAQGGVLATETARLGLVRGAAGTATRCVTDTASTKWRKVKDSAVLPIPEDATALEIDGTSVMPLDVPGWHQWRGIGAGAHELSLTASSGDISVSLLGTGGLVILLK